MKTFVIILAAGKGERMNAGKNKVLLPVCGKTVIRRSIEAFSSFADEMIIVSRDDERSLIMHETENAGLSFPVRFVSGGETRQQSVLNALLTLSWNHGDIVLIHDAARCLADHKLISRVIHSTVLYGSTVPGIPASSTYKICDQDRFVTNTPERSFLYEIQTPQGFPAETIIPASVRAAEDHVICTDDAGILEHYHFPVKIIDGDSSNIKLTEPDDLNRAKMILEGGVSSSMRVGMGYDVHRLVAGRKLILCGVEIPFDLGLLGHSDADVALHALMDAMLGACALGDIGRHFPDTDEQFKDVSSMVLLRETIRILSSAGFEVHNADITIVAQKPKILPFISEMIRRVAAELSLPENHVNIKATTTETLGFEGRLEGISAYAVCTVSEMK